MTWTLIPDYWKGTSYLFLESVWNVDKEKRKTGTNKLLKMNKKEIFSNSMRWRDTLWKTWNTTFLILVWVRQSGFVCLCVRAHACTHAWVSVRVSSEHIIHPTKPNGISCRINFALLSAQYSWKYDLCEGIDMLIHATSSPHMNKSN